MENSMHSGDWLFQHDALTQMTCHETIDWMKSKDFYKRWMLPELGVNDGTTYAGRPVGNSPEFMAWDCSLNKDVDDAFFRHRQMTSNFDDDDPRKFCASTPNRLDSAYMRLVDPANGTEYGSPTSGRIIQDITRCLTKHLLAVIDAKGAVVPGLGSRTGHRYVPGVEKWGGRREKSLQTRDYWYHPDSITPGVSVLEMFRNRNASQQAVV